MDSEKLALSIASSSLLRGEFKRALETTTDDSFIPRPWSLSKGERTRNQGIKSLKELIDTQKQAILKRADLIKSLDVDLSRLAAQDLGSKSLFLQQTLEENGAMYGDYSFNFCLSDLPLPKQIITDIAQTATVGFETLLQCQPINRKGNFTENYFDNLALKPSGARVDIILTEDGPRVIEVNLQWVDGIQALEGFQVAYLGKRQRAVETLANVFKGRRRLMILNLTKASGSRLKGPQFELEILARNLKARYPFSEVEISDPIKISSSYLNKFDAFYLNGEPRMVQEDKIPEWIEIIANKMRWDRIFPTWRPALDRKTMLIEASQQSEVFVQTLPYSQSNLENAKKLFGKVVVKGDGYSSNCVGIQGQNGFEDILTQANLSPEGFVIQPLLRSFRVKPIFCYDTSSGIPVLLKTPRSKFNVWIINGRVVGILASLSDSIMISDKDFNTVPRPI